MNVSSSGSQQPIVLFDIVDSSFPSENILAIRKFILFFLSDVGSF